MADTKPMTADEQKAAEQQQKAAEQKAAGKAVSRETSDKDAEDLTPQPTQAEADAIKLQGGQPRDGKQERDMAGSGSQSYKTR
jgi:hypothetical protein